MSTSSFTVQVFPPASTPEPIVEYRVTIGNAPGEQSFTIPAGGGGTVTAPVPVGANLNPDTIYPYSVVAVGANGQLSPIVNSFGTTLKANNAPTNMIGGSHIFSGVISVPPNTAVALNALNGNALSAGDNSNAENLTVTFQPTAGNFGTISLSNNPALPGTVTVTGGGTNGSPLVISGPKADVNTALNNFVYTPQNGFVGPATVTMTTVDQVEGPVTPDDADTLVFSVNSATPAPPRNLMNGNPTFSNLLTAVNTTITLRPSNNSHLGAEDNNGDNLTTVLTPANGTISLVTVPAGVTVSGAGTAASPLQLVGLPHFVSTALNGGLIFTPTNNFVGNGTIQMVSTANDGSDTDTVTIQVVNPSNLFNGSTTFPATAQSMAKATTTLLNGAGNKALTVLYPAASTVRVNLTLLDGAGNNAGAAANGSLTVGALAGVTVSNNGTADLQLEGLASDVNALLTAGVTYSPQGNNVGNYRLRMNSVNLVPNPAAPPPLIPGALTDTNDILLLEVSEPPQNRYNNSPTAFPPAGSPIELGFDTPLTFASFFGTALSVLDGDSASVTVTLRPSQEVTGVTIAGSLSRANTNPIPTGVTVVSGTTTLNAGSTAPITATHANPMVITGSPAQINAFFNNGIVFTPESLKHGAATVTMTSTDGAGTDTDIAHINVLNRPENRRNDNATFITTAIPAAPGVAAIMNNPNEFTLAGPPAVVGPTDRLLTVRNYPSAANVDVTLTVPTGKGTLLLNGFPAPNGVQGGVTLTGNGTNNLQMTGTQANLNTALTNLRYTPNAALVAAPETVNITMTSSGGTLGDSGDTVPFSISNPPRNIYNAQDGNPVTDDTAENTSFPSTGTRLAIFNQAVLFNNTATATQPAVRLDVIDDSATVKVTLKPANTLNNTAAVLDLTAAAPGTVTNTGAGTNASPRVLSGPLADVKTALTLLRYTPQANFADVTSFTIEVDDGGPTPDLNTVHLNVQARPLNEFNTTTTTFPGTAIPMVIGIANPIADDTGTPVINSAIHEIGVKNLSSYTSGQTATVRLQIPNGTLNVNLTPAGVGAGEVTITAGANGSGDLTLSATHPNILKLNTVLGTLTWTPGALADGVAPTAVNLTMTHGPISDTSNLPLLATRPPRNLYNGNTDFALVTRRVVNEGTDLTFTAGTNTLVSVGSQTVETVEDSSNIRVTLTPSQLSGQTSGTVKITTSGSIKLNGSVTASANGTAGSGTNSAPLILEGSPTDVNATLASMAFESRQGANGNAQIDMVTTDFGSRDLTDSILLDVRARPSNRYRIPFDGVNFTNTFPDVVTAPRSVGLNSPYLLDNTANGAGNTDDRPQVQVEFYNAGLADVTVDLTLATVGNTATGNLQVTTANSTVTGNNSAALKLVGTQAQVNADLLTLRYNAPNSSGTVDMEMRSSSVLGGVGDNTANQDRIRFDVQNQRPVNEYTSATSRNAADTNDNGFTATAPLVLPLKVVNEDDVIDFAPIGGIVDPTANPATNLTLTGNTWGRLSVRDDNTTVTTTVTPPDTGTLSFRSVPAVAPTGGGTNASPFVWTNRTPAEINAALELMRFTPNAGATGPAKALTITTSDGTNTDTDTLSILVEANNVPATADPDGAGSLPATTPNPHGIPFRAVYQLGRDNLPQIIVSDIVISGPQIRDGATLDIIRHNDNDPASSVDTTQTVLHTITLNNPGPNASVTFDNTTNRAKVTINANAIALPRTLTDGSGKIGARLKDGNISAPVNSPVGTVGGGGAPDTHPYHFFVFPERAIYGVEDLTTTTGKYYLVNTSTTAGAGLGRLDMLFDSSGAASAQTGKNNTAFATAGLAKHPTTGKVYFIDEQTGPVGRLIEWTPSLGIIDIADPANTPTPRPFNIADPFRIVDSSLSVSVAGSLTSTTYNFGDKPARMAFNTNAGGTSLYVSEAPAGSDTAGVLSGFYRFRNYDQAVTNANAVAIDIIPVIDDATDAQLLYLNNGDIAFEPPTGIADNRMFMTIATNLYYSAATVPHTGTTEVRLKTISLTTNVTGAQAQPARTLMQYDPDGAGPNPPVNPNGYVGLSFDGEWSAGNPSFLVIAKYANPNDIVSRLYRLEYDRTTFAIKSVTLLNNGTFPTQSLVDITSAHLQ
ncbi:MAG: beta strand repeat-containing protein [Candidatus Sericytochromatia bacterium]